MGKRASAPKAKPPAKRSKVSLAAPPPAPAVWARPIPPVLTERDPLAVFLLDIEDGQSSTGTGDHELRLYGITKQGHSVCARIHNFHPYFYVRCGPEVVGRENEIQAALQAAMPPSPGGSQKAIVAVQVVRRTPILYFQAEEILLMVSVAGPKLVSPCLKALEGLQLSNSEVQATAVFEANIALILRFLIDNDLGGGRWIEFEAGAFLVVSETSRSTTAQIELDIHLGHGTKFRALPMDTDAGSFVPPLRTAALELSVDVELQLVTAAACVLTVEGQAQPIARAVWLRALATQQVTEEAADSAVLFLSEDEEVLLQHLGETLATMDADIILTYDLSETVRRMLGKKGIAKAGSPLARSLCRRLGAEVKLTPKSNEVSGMTGRLGFDLQKQVEKDHRLVDYSLGALSQHFCRTPLPELSAATRAKILRSRPRAYAQHLLRQAEASAKIFHHLAYLYNFVEMARVTGCPLSYLLERGQAIKVQCQLLREARVRGFVLPQRPGTGEDTTYEGATVLEPACGFYRCPIAVLDFASLYPSIMMAHNLCYSTLLPPGREKKPDCPDFTESPPTAGSEHATCFVKSQVRKGLLPSILERLLAARKAAKAQLAQCEPGEAGATRRKVLHGRQLALKLSANSVYGFTGATNGPLPCLEVAGAVTAYGREMIQATKAKVEQHFTTGLGYPYNAEVVYGDTDSVMVKFGPEGFALDEAIKASKEASTVCSSIFPAPVRLEFEKVYQPFLLMAKKRYAGMAFASSSSSPELETKGIETVRRDWCDLVRHGLEETLKRLLASDGSDGCQKAIAHVRDVCNDLRQNKIDFRSLVISKSLGRNEYTAKAPHAEVAEKLKKRDATTAPRLGDRVSYLVLAGAAKAKVYEKAEDPLYALENDLPIDADYYLENQLKQPLLRVFELVCGDVHKAESLLFGGLSSQKVVVSTSKGGMGKFVKPRPKCLSCSADIDGAVCTLCKEKLPEIKAQALGRARALAEELSQLRAQCARDCAVPSGAFPQLPDDEPVSDQGQASERCLNEGCPVIFNRARVAKQLGSAREALQRLDLKEA
ncbi:POLD1 [Symbiodinium sp. CCMP2456]|nr:POLD1 [Symbiodinium sp. CCMP2456]